MFLRGRVEGESAVLPSARPLRWAVLSAVAAAVAVGWVVLFVVDSGLAPTPTEDPPLAGMRSAMLAVVPLLALVLSGYGVWRARLEALAGRPGPILVAPVVDRTAEGADDQAAERTPLAEELTARFQHALVSSRVYGSTAVPSTGRPSDFLAVVEQAGESLTGFWAALGRATRILSPVSAYRVRCTLLRGRDDRDHGDDEEDDGGDHDGECVILVELTRPPSTSMTPTLVRAPTWDRAVLRAAHLVASVVLPCTRQCRLPPWTTWQGLRLPAGLFDRYQHFVSLRAARRDDEALAVLREAIRRDPGNLALRLELGKLQEQLEMYLDALLTYDDVIGLASRRDRRLRRWWNAEPTRDDEDPEGGGEWSNPARAPGLAPTHPVVQVARYRHALLLGLGDAVAEQWWHRPEHCREGAHQSAREARREHLRRTLRARFARRYDGIASLLTEAGLTADRRYLDRPVATTEEDVRVARAADLRVFLTSAGVMEIERLAGERRRAGWTTPFALRRVLSLTQLELAVPLLCLRRAMALAGSVARAPDGTEEARAAEEAERRRRVAVAERSVLRAPLRLPALPYGLFRRGWPAPLGAVSLAVVGPLYGRSAARRSWHEHYTAACCYALLLAPDDPAGSAHPAPRGPEEEAARRRVARTAIDELGRAVAAGSPDRLARERDWVLSEDPDLDHLRGRAEFRDFEALTFGSVRRATRRGPRTGAWEQITGVAQFVSAAAEVVAGLWERRLAEVLDSVPAGVTLWRWLDDEVEGWRMLERLALDHRDPVTRDAVAGTVVGWARREGVVVEHPATPRFSERRLARQLAVRAGEDSHRPVLGRSDRGDGVADRVTAAISGADGRVRALAAALRVEAPDDRDDCCSQARRTVYAEEAAALRAHFGTGFPADRALVVAWCRAGGQRWRALAEWFDDATLRGTDVAAREERFRDAVRTPVC